MPFLSPSIRHKPTSEKDKSEPEKQIKPRKRPVKKWFGLSKSQWKELSGFLVLVPWLYYDMCDSHELSKLCLLGISIAIAQGVIFSFLRSRIKAIALWAVSVFIIADIVWIQSKSEPKPYPHFVFSILNDGIIYNALELTNKFLTPEVPGPVSMGAIFFRVKNQSDFSLKLAVQNNGPIVSEHAWIRISLPEELVCSPNPGWEYNQNNSWTFRPPDLLPGDGWELPTLVFHNVPFRHFFGNMGITILTRAKDSPARIVLFSPVFVPISSDETTTPIVQPAKLISGALVISILGLCRIDGDRKGMKGLVV